MSSIPIKTALIDENPTYNADMRRIAVLATAMLVHGAFADRVHTSWAWPGWKVETGEELFSGTTHRSYPATLLFDNDRKTAWVFSGISNAEKVRRNYVSAEKGARNTFWITVKPSISQPFDGFEIMNGYNKSRATFLGNRRVVGLEVWERGGWFEPDFNKKIKSARLSDKEGWHRVSLPKRNYPDGITLRFTQFAGAPSLDLALSGLRLLKNGRPVDVKMPNVVAFTIGSDCG